MSFRTRLIVIFSATVFIVVVTTASILGYNARETIIREAERDGEVIAQLLARSAGAAESIPNKVEEILGEQMIAQANLVAEYVALGESGNLPAEDITARLSSVVDRTTINEIWVTDSFGHAYINTAGVPDFIFHPDEQTQPQASEFWPLLTSNADVVIQDAQPREIDDRLFKYVGISGVDQPRVVQVGMDASELEELADQIGLEFMIQSLVDGGEINAIWVFSSDLEAVASGTVMAVGAHTEPREQEMDVMRQVLQHNQTQSILEPDQLVVMAPIPDDDGQPQGVTLLRLPLDELQKTQQQWVWLSVQITAVMVFLGLFLAWVLARRMTRPVALISEGAHRIEQGNFNLDVLKPVQKRHDELGKLAKVFASMAEKVNAREAWLDAQVKARTQELEDKNEQLGAAHEKIQEELNVARALQIAILPGQFPNRNGADIHGRMRPAREMGGDFYDVFELDEHRIGLVVADVSGKGVPAGFFMAISRTELQLAAANGRRPGEVLAEVNDQLTRQNPLELFVTVFYGIYDLNTGRLTYANGGHNPPLLMDRDGNASWLPTTGGMALGVMDEMPYAEKTILVHPDDRLLLFSDGITEAFNLEGEEFGEDNLAEVVRNTGLSAMTVIDAVFNAVDNYSTGVEQSDDMTVLVLSRRNWQPQPEQTGGDRDMDRPANSLNTRPLPENLDQVTEFIRGQSEAFGVGMAQAMQLELVVDELFTNIVHYGYPADQRSHGEVDLQVSKDGEQLIIRLSDNGRPFDPTDIPPPNIHADIEEREIGGLGMHIVREAVDHMDYNHDDGRNNLVLTISIKPE